MEANKNWPSYKLSLEICLFLLASCSSTLHVDLFGAGYVFPLTAKLSGWKGRSVIEDRKGGDILRLS